MDIKELEKQFSELQGQVGLLKKDFELKLAAANGEAEQWKKIAQQKEADALKFQEDAKKAKEAEAKAFAEARAAENKAFLEKLKAEGRITPAMQDVATKLMESMTSQEIVATFDMKDGKKVSHTQFSLFKEFLSSFQKSSVLKGLTPGGGSAVEVPGDGDGTEQQFTEILQGGQKVRVPLDDTNLHMSALEYIEDQKKIGRVVGYADALIEVSKTQKKSRAGA